MPIYEYVCEKCGKLSDVWQKVSDPPPNKCEECGAEGPLTKCLSRTSFVLKGGGWYSDLYGSSKKDSSGSKAKEGGQDKGSSSSSGSASTSSSSGSGGGSSSAPK